MDLLMKYMFRLIFIAIFDAFLFLHAKLVLNTKEREKNTQNAEKESFKHVFINLWIS